MIRTGFSCFRYKVEKDRGNLSYGHLVSTLSSSLLLLLLLLLLSLSVRTVFLVIQPDHSLAPGDLHHLLIILVVPSKRAFRNGRILPSSPAFFKCRCSEGSNDDRYKHNFFTIPQMLQLTFLVLVFFDLFPFFKTYSMVKWASNICCAQFCGQFE